MIATPFTTLLGPLSRNRRPWPTWLGSVPADVAQPNAPILQQYVFRPGGFYQPQRSWLLPTAADQSAPNQPLVPQYTFRRGGFYQPQKGRGVVVVIPPPVIVPPLHGGIRREMSEVSPHWPYPVLGIPPEKDMWLILLLTGEITFEEFEALMNQARAKES